MNSEMLAKQENDYVKTTFSYLWANSRFYIFICTEKRLLSILRLPMYYTKIPNIILSLSQSVPRGIHYVFSEFMSLLPPPKNIKLLDTIPLASRYMQIFLRFSVISLLSSCDSLWQCEYKNV